MPTSSTLTERRTLLVPFPDFAVKGVVVPSVEVKGKVEEVKDAEVPPVEVKGKIEEVKDEVKGGGVVSFDPFPDFPVKGGGVPSVEVNNVELVPTEARVLAANGPMNLTLSFQFLVPHNCVMG